jgi:hypothetical protein
LGTGSFTLDEEGDVVEVDELYVPQLCYPIEEKI